MPAKWVGVSWREAEKDCAPGQRARRAQSTSLLKRTAWGGRCWRNATGFGEFLQQQGGLVVVVRVVTVWGAEKGTLTPALSQWEREKSGEKPKFLRWQNRGISMDGAEKLDKTVCRLSGCSRAERRTLAG